MKLPLRPITDAERERASARIVDPEALSKRELLSRLGRYDYTELANSVSQLNNTERLTIEVLYDIWGAITRTLDQCGEVADLDKLETQCASIVTAPWDEEMEISDSK